MSSRLENLVKLADFADRMGNAEAADFLDGEIIKEAKKGYHKCGLKEETVQHHTELYEAYKKAHSHFSKKHKRLFNGTDNKDSPNMGELREIAKGISHNGNAEFLHELYFEDAYESKPYATSKNANLEKLFKAAYSGKFKDFGDDLKRMANVSRNGWVVLSYCFKEKQLYLDVFDLHEIGPRTNSVPVLALDMWEHAYIIDFGLDKEAYVDWFLGRVDWRKVGKRLKNYQRVH